LSKSTGKKGREATPQPQEPLRSVDAIMTLRVYRPVITRVGGVTLRVYEPLDEYESIEKISLKTRKDAVDAVYNKLVKDRHKLFSPHGDSLVEGEVKGTGFELLMGRSEEHREGLEPQLLFPRPARLLRLGLIRGGEIKWVKPRRGAQYYVFEGPIDLPKDVEAVIIETDRGRSVIKATGNTLGASRGGGGAEKR